MSRDQNNIEHLEKKLNYLQKQVKEMSGEMMKHDFIISNLKIELNQKKQSFTLLTNLQKSFGFSEDESSFFDIAVRSINAMLGMNNSLILSVNNNDSNFSPAKWYGYQRDRSSEFSGLSIEFPDHYLKEDSYLLVNKSVKPDQFINKISTTFDLPFFICVPILLDKLPIGIILTGKQREGRSAFLPLGQSDVETLQAVATLISSFVRKKQMAALQEADRYKTEFLANMSHEIRTPMNAVLGFTEILQGMISDKQQKEYLNGIQSSGKALLSLINDILDLTKVEMGKVELEYSETDIHALFFELKQIFSHKFRQKEIDFILEIEKEIPAFLLLDEVRLRQILFNLVGNAVKFTEKGYVKLTLEKRYREADQSALDLLFSIEDTGIGIPKDQLLKIFNPFEQQKGQSYAKYGGSGLGLAITKRLIEMMDGKISVSSEPGKGSTFYVELNNINVVAVSEFDSKSKSEIDTVNIEFKPASILVVDDIEYNRNVVSGLLIQFNFILYEAENGKEAIEYAIKHQPDLILMDMKMPVMDGYVATKHLKENK